MCRSPSPCHLVILSSCHRVIVSPRRHMIEKTKLGILLFIASEVVFFASLILAYVYYSGFYDDWPNGVAALEPLTTGFFTLALLSSSATLWLAERSQARGRHSGLRLWLLATIVLGATFLVGQGL